MNPRFALVLILILAAAVRLKHLDSPVADSLMVKQSFTSNKARCIAGPPFDVFKNSFDFLDERGERMELTEEVPLYSIALAAGFRVFGERAWIGHALSLLGTLAALVALFDLVRREIGEREALASTALMAAAPLLIFYGRAVMPDSWMLAAMIGSAACFRRFLDGEGRRWFVLAALFGMLAGMFKYFGLMVAVPLAEMAWRASGTWRAVFSRRFLALMAAMVGPMAVWMAVVFFRTRNPVESGWVEGHVYPYFLFQRPDVLLSKTIYGAFFGRFLFRDCGPVLGVLMLVGIASAVRRRARPSGMLVGWTVMGLGFFALLAPKLRDHDYYALMVLPAFATWGALGLEAIASRPSARRLAIVPIVLGLAFAVQSPWVMGGLFRLDEGKLVLAGRLRELCPEGGRVVAIGPGIEFPTVVHHSHREGWPIHSPELPADWRSRLAHYRELGASHVAVYFEPKATAAERASYRPLLEEFPTIEHLRGPETRAGGPCEFFILALRRKDGEINRQAAKERGEDRREIR